MSVSEHEYVYEIMCVYVCVCVNVCIEEREFLCQKVHQISSDLYACKLKKKKPSFSHYTLYEALQKPEIYKTLYSTALICPHRHVKHYNNHTQLPLYQI